MSSTQQSGFVDNLVAAVRENPLAAALIGGGALWLLAGNENLKKTVSSATAAASSLSDVAARNARATASALQRTASPPTAPDGTGDNLRGATSAAADAVSGAAEQIRDGLSQSVASAREKIASLGDALPDQETYTKVQSKLADLLDRQPLILGAVGIVVGAAIAGAFRTSDIEDEWLGGISDDVKADLQARAEAASQSIRDSAQTLKDELGDTGAEALDRVKQAGRDTVTTIQDRVRSPSPSSPSP